MQAQTKLMKKFDLLYKLIIIKKDLVLAESLTIR